MCKYWEINVCVGIEDSGMGRGTIVRYLHSEYMFSWHAKLIYFFQADPQARNVLTRRKKSSESEEEEEEEQKEEAEEEEEEEDSDEENQGYTPLDYAGDDEEVIVYSLDQNNYGTSW